MNQPSDWLSQPDGLADRLRELRTSAGLAGKDLAKATGWAASKVSRLERGRQTPSAADLDAWVRACNAEPGIAHELMRMLGEVQTVHRVWRRSGSRGQAAVQARYNDLVHASELIRSFTTSVVPGLLQTRDYAHRILTEMRALHGMEIDDVDDAVTMRLRRQQMLYERGKGFEFLITEPVLRWLICPPEVMRAQLDRLQTVIDVPNIRFGILPIGQPIATTPQNSFDIFDDVALVETFVGETEHRDAEAEKYARVMDLLWEEAVTGSAARRLIIAAADALPR